MKVTIETSMKCGGCLQKVGPLLDAEPAVATWQADLDNPSKLLKLELRPKTEVNKIVEIVRDAGFEANLHEGPQGANQPNPQIATPAFKLSRYKPLFLVVAYVIGCTALIESIQGEWLWGRAMNSFMGFFFLGFAFFKLLDISRFADAFATYDVIARRSRFYALGYPFVELVLGLLFVTGTWLIAAYVTTAVIMSVGLIGVVSAVSKKQAIQCACLGTAFNLPMSVVTIVENSVMIVMAVVMLVS